jgi:hypothetical protein
MEPIPATGIGTPGGAELRKGVAEELLRAFRPGFKALRNSFQSLLANSPARRSKGALAATSPSYANIEKTAIRCVREFQHPLLVFTRNCNQEGSLYRPITTGFSERSRRRGRR